MSKPGTDLQSRVDSIQKTTNPTVDGNIALFSAALIKLWKFVTRTGTPENNVPSLRGASIGNHSDKNILSDDIMNALNPQELKKKSKKQKLSPKPTKEELKEKTEKLSQKIKKQAEEAVRPITKKAHKKSKKLHKRVKKIMREL